MSPAKSAEALLRKVFPPMLATLTDRPPRDERNWAYEWKYDGFRAVAAIVDGKVAVWSRNELDLAPRFPAVAAALSKLTLPDVVLDGEIVVLDEHGAPRFQLLQQGDRREVIVVFDILWLDGEDLRKRSYDHRRAILVKTLRRTPVAIKVAERLETGGDAALERAKKSGWEGIIAKHRSSAYAGRRSKEWLKIKASREQELIVVGWHPSTHSAREIGSLHLAVVGEDGDLHYAGKVGTGFSLKQRLWWKEELLKDVVPKTMVKDAPRERISMWVRPRFVVQVSFTEWTADNRLRHPSFKGLREDKKVGDVIREGPGGGESAIGSRKPTGGKSTASSRKSASKNSSSTKSQSRRPSSKQPASKSLSAKPLSESRLPTTSSPVNLTHPDRILYPRDGISKQDVADYYAAIATPMVRALRDRPLALEHWNDGIDRPSWFHQDVGRGAPPWVTTIDTPTRTTSHKSVRHLVADRPETLRWLAQMSVLTIHMWASRAASLEEPDWLVFDLDPAKGKGIEQAIDAAVIIRRLLDTLRLPSVPKTSGKRGIHVLIPLVGGYTHEEANAFACSIGAAVASKVPEFTMERALNRRQGRLYLDCMQNAYGKTIVAPYSLRAIDGAPVSAPLKWDEVTKKLDPKKFNLRTMPDRLARVGDLFARVFEERVKLPELK